MLWYVAFIAALNLCLGYLWAARTRSCPDCWRRRSGRAAAVPVRPGNTAPVTTSAATRPSLAGEAAPSGIAPSVERPRVERPLGSFFAGLENFRTELSDVDERLEKDDQSAEHVAECAQRLRAASDHYIDTTSGALEALDETPFNELSRDAGQSMLKTTFRDQADMTRAKIEEIDALDIVADPLAARDALRKTRGDFDEATSGLHAEVDECLRSVLAEFDIPDPEPPREPATPCDPETGLATRLHAESLLEQWSTDDADREPVTIALLELDMSDLPESAKSDTIEQRLVCGVSNIVRQALTADHTAARFDTQQFLLLMPSEDVHHATRRAEEMRQRVATTEFVVDGQALQTTVTCALAELTTQQAGPRLIESLQEALGEAQRYGGNRTFMHDGNSPSPVVPPELMLAPQQLAI